MSSKDTNPKDAVAGTKVPLWLLSPIAKAKWALAMFSGLIKYGAWNWRIAGVLSSVYLSAAQRHLDAYLSGEEVDPADGTDHRANVMACMAILMDAEAAGKLTDDRPPSVGIRATYAQQEQLMVKLKEQYADKSPRHYTIADTEPPPTADWLCVSTAAAPTDDWRRRAFAKAERREAKKTAKREQVPSPEDDYCAVCDHDFCQCSQKSAERGWPR